uniref:Fibrinogen C-terminal domain-containing protein n=1 Tax=Strongyloides papillosus TaxID=174720 RepID=A0A0N5BMI9_STREA
MERYGLVSSLVIIPIITNGLVVKIISILTFQHNNHPPPYQIPEFILTLIKINGKKSLCSNGFLYYLYTSFWNKTWNEYKNGFGNGETNFWLGNELISLFTNSFEKVEMLIQIRGDRLDKVDPMASSNYWSGTFTFNLLPEYTDYTIQLSNATGNATGNGWDDFSYSNGWKFSTIDKINSPYPPCLTQFHMGGWWYNYCGFGSLNGQYNPPIAEDRGYGFSWSITEPTRIVNPVKSRITIREITN